MNLYEGIPDYMLDATRAGVKHAKTLGFKVRRDDGGDYEIIDPASGEVLALGVEGRVGSAADWADKRRQGLLP